ncbi:PH domain-containing protein [Priestia filamentosa]|uniref:PH domain-containing protein n=1 Tax=Priestia filamentosa TaxID=1402861 RepID=UPI003981E158
MNKRRDHFIEFGYHTFRTIKDNIYPFIGFVIALVGAQNYFNTLVKYGSYALMAFVIIYSFLKWYNKTFEFDDNMIRISEGVFEKRKNDIPISRVKSINTEDSIFKRMFKISNLSVEVIGGHKIVFVLRSKEIDHLKTYLFQEVEKREEKLSVQKFSLLQYILLALTDLRTFIGSLSIIFPLWTFVITQVASMNGMDVESSKGNSNIIEDIKFLSQVDFLDSAIILPTVCIIIAGFLTTFIVSIVLNYLKYKKFEITSNPTDIEIRYGIINKKEYHIPKPHIRSIRISEPLIFRLFGYVQLKVDNIGFSENESASVMTYPIIKKATIASFLNNHLPTFEQQSITLKPMEGTFFSFLVPHIAKVLFLTAVLMVFSRHFIYLLSLLLIALLLGYMNWKYTGLSFNETFTTIRMSKGTKVITLITLKKYVDTTETRQHILMRRRNSCHYSVSLYTENSEEIYKCKHLAASEKGSFLQYLKQ